MRDRSVPFEGKFGLNWISDFEVLGIKHILSNSAHGTIFPLNYRV